MQAEPPGCFGDHIQHSNHRKPLIAVDNDDQNGGAYPIVVLAHEFVVCKPLRTSNKVSVVTAEDTAALQFYFTILTHSRDSVWKDHLVTIKVI